MGDFSTIAKLLIIFGILLTIVGVLLFFIGKLPYIGKLPGDIYIKRENYSFYFPVVTCILLSILLTLILNLFRR
jgi:hypothetical protein